MSTSATTTTRPDPTPDAPAIELFGPLPRRSGPRPDARVEAPP